MDHYYRANLINPVSGIKSANLIGTTNADGQTNLAIFNSVMHIGANPPLLSFIVRPHSVERHTYENIKATGYFTINAVNDILLARAHMTSGKYPKGVSEFIMCNIKPTYSNLHPAPYVQESPIQLGLKLEEEHHIKSNQTILIIGRIIELKVSGGNILDDGHLNLPKLNLVACNGLDTYCKPKKFIKKSYVTSASIK